MAPARGARSRTFRMLRRFVDVDPGETRAVVLACLYFFFTFSSWFVLRPIRDEMAVAAGVRDLSWMFFGTLVVTLVANALYASLVARLPVRRFVALTYQIFALCLVAFWVAWRARSGEGAGVWTGRIFFAWTSMFSLFVASVFWSVMADAFRSGQAKRLFGFIGVGGTLGAIAGSAATALLARSLGPVNLLLVSLALLELAAVLALAFYAAAPGAAAARRADEDDATAAAAAAAVDDVAGVHGAPRPRAIGGSAWAGVTHVSRSPYLLGIAVFLVLYTFGSTVLYFAQTEIVGATVGDRAARTELLARMELAAQVLTAVTQAFFTGRIIRRVGLAAALAFLPAISVLGFAAVGASAWGLTPALATIVAFSVLRRASNYALTNPAMEALFTVVSREDKYKAKSFIETFVYRAGDQLAAWGYAGLAALGLGVAGISWVTVPFSAVFLALGVWLGRRQRELARRQTPPAVAEPHTSARPVEASA